MRSYLFLAEGFEETEVVATLDILRRGGVETLLVSTTGELLVHGTHGVGIEADLLFDASVLSEGEMLVLPGGMPGTLNLFGFQPLLELIEVYRAKGRLLAAICAAPLIYGRRGMMAGHRATIYPGFQNHMKGVILTGERVVVSGQYVTAIGPGASVEFGLKIVELLKGKATSDEVASGFIV